MLILSGLHIRYAICTIAVLSFVPTYSQHTPPEEQQRNHRPGKYEPELHTNRGKYVPDYRGQYQHIHIPYDGGYGDRGLKYQHDLRDFIQEPNGRLTLGPKDHLRFMIDFNFNGSGWQVIQFEWTRDGTEGHQVNYVNENRLWDIPDYNNDPYGPKVATKVHVDGEYVPSKYNETDAQDDEQRTHNAIEIQGIIKDLLDYIQLNILPNLN